MSEETAVCRGCRSKLRGQPYYKGGNAYSLETGKEVKKCHYGGFVCSRSCDVRACLDLESSMPGCGTIKGYSQLSPYAKQRIETNWPEGQ